MAKKKKKAAELEKGLVFSRAVFDEGFGEIYDRINRWSLPGVLVLALVLAVINAGMDVAGLPLPAKILFYLGIIYGSICVFVWPTSFFIQQGRIRLLKESYIEVYRDMIIYYKCDSKTLNTPHYTPLSVERIRTAEQSKRYLTLKGDILNRENGRRPDVLKIPAAFEDMEAVARLARR